MPRIVSNTLVNQSVNLSSSQTVARSAAAIACLAGILLTAGCGTSGNSTAAVPTFTPAAGQYNAAQTVTISDTTPGAVLHCTTDGSAPTTSSPVCSEPTTISKTQTLSAIAVLPGGSPSAVATAAYTIDLPLAATPSFSTPAGTYASAQTVSLMDTTSGASIYYTIDGSKPSASSTLFSLNAPIMVSGDVPTVVTISAIAIASGYADSAISTETFTITPSAVAPVITPIGGDFIGARSGVTISDSTPGAMIYYAFTPGTGTPSAVTTSATLYSASTPITVPATGTISAIAVAPGFTPSTQIDALFNLSAVAPVISPAGGNYTTVQSVTLADTTAGANIYYTVTPNGSTPVPLIPNTPGVMFYTTGAPISVAASETISALAVATGFSNSAAASAQFTITLPPAATPVITLASGTTAPATGTYNSVQTVSITDGTSGATIYYTTDGSNPGPTHGTAYTGPITVSTSETIKAVAKADTSGPSTAATAQFNLVTATPTISLGSGNYTSTQSVTLSDATTTAAIYYSLRGPAPSVVNGTVVNGILYQAGSPISVTHTETLQAIAVETGFSPSAVVSATYTFNLTKASLPTFSPVAGTYTAAQSVRLSDSTSGVTIYYTTDGSDPRTSLTAALYSNSSPIAVSKSETLMAYATVASGYNDSAVAAAAYIINLTATPTPTISASPAPAYLSTQTVTVTLNDTDANSTIFYTVTAGSTGTTPTAGSSFCAPGSTQCTIAVSKTETIEAYATENNRAQSATASATYTLTVPTPKITDSGFSGTTDTITLTDDDANATIYYTTDGMTPNTGSTKYTAPFTIANPETIKAIAARTGYATSAPATDVITKTTCPTGSICGTVSSGTAKISGAKVQLYAAGTSGYGSVPTTIGTAFTTLADGKFQLPISCASHTAPADLIYVVATGGNSAGGTSNAGLGLMTALGHCASLSNTPVVTVNEVTTIASVYSLSGFAAFPSSGGGIDIGVPTGTPSSATCPTASIGQVGGNPGCNYPGLANAFATVNNLVDIGTGTARTITPAYATGTLPFLNTSSVPQSRINTLADILATCVDTATGCNSLFGDVSGTNRKDTLQAALDIAQNPSHNVATLYALLQTAPPYTPTLKSPTGTDFGGNPLNGDTSAPQDWTLAITYTGAGLGVDPSDPNTTDKIQGKSLAIDGLGNVWAIAGASQNNSGMIAGFSNLGVPLTPATTYDTTMKKVMSFGGFGPHVVSACTNHIASGGIDLTIDASNNLWEITGGNGYFVSRVSFTGGNPSSPVLNCLSATPDGSITLPTAAAFSSLAFDPNGKLWVSAANSTFYEFSPNTGVKVASPFTRGISELYDLTFDSNGSLWGGDQGNGDIRYYTLTNPITLAATYTKAQGYNLAAGAGGNIYTCNSSASGVYYDLTASASTTFSNSGGAGCTPLVVDGGGDIWSLSAATFSSYLTKVGADGRLLTPSNGYTGTSGAELPTIFDAVSNPLNGPGMGVDGSGNIWVLNSLNSARGGTITGNMLTEFVGVAAPTIASLALATQNGAQGTKP